VTTYGQAPLAPMAAAEPPGHASVHVEPPPQLTEQLPVHVMWQVAPPEQSTLALLPTVIVHIDCPVHLRLHDSPHWPVQSLPLLQSREQLLSQVPAPRSHAWLAGQLQDAPLQVGGLPLLLLLQAAIVAEVRRNNRARVRMTSSYDRRIAERECDLRTP
jgi:hypothetical protein